MDVIRLLPTGHNNKDQWDLLHRAIMAGKSVHCEELPKRMTAQFKSAINVPALGPGQVAQSVGCCKDQMSPSMDISALKKSSEMWSSARVKFRSFGTCGRLDCQ